MAKVCIARVDRIGDLILTLPVEKIWKTERPLDQVFWLVHENLKFVMNQVESQPKAFYVGNSKNPLTQIKASLALARQLREVNFDEVIAVHVPWWVAFAFFMAAIPKRLGVASQWFSWIFFNHRLRQKRSQALKHESEYNLDLILFALGAEKSRPLLLAAKLHPLEKSVEKWKSFLRSKNVNLEKMVVMHPGMSGSAQNWPAARYQELAAKLLAQGISLVITGGAPDKKFLEATKIQSMSGIISVVDQTDGYDLVALLSLAACVVAPSTGVAHLAASLGVPVAGIYSPVKVQAPLRWGPKGLKVKVFVPDVRCPGERRCLGMACDMYDCMDQIPVDLVADYVIGEI